jgi:hypothetical protein
VFAADSFSAGAWRGGERDAAGVTHMPWFEYAEPVRDFWAALYEHRWVVSFDWPGWQHEAERLLTGGGIDTADVATLRRLLTTLVRRDRFVEGFLASAFEQGWIVAILRRAEALADRR